MKSLVRLVLAGSVLMLSMGCSSMWKLNYPEGKTVTMAPWTASQNTKPTGQVIYTKTKLCAATNDDITKAMDECISKAEATSINNLTIKVIAPYYVISTILISGEVSK